MGLDMYMYGVIEYYNDFENEENNKLDKYGFRLCTEEYSVAYWRKHPNLHGFIVNTFADGEDNCQKIYLTKENLNDIIKSVEKDNLPYTEGFFFGRSPDINSDDPYETKYAKELKKNTMEILNKILDWLEDRPTTNSYKYVYYQASW